MAVEFRNVVLPPLGGVSVTAPNGAVIGIVGDKGSGKSALLPLAAGLDQPDSGTVSADEPRRLIGIGDPLVLENVATLALDNTFASLDAVERGRALSGIEHLRRGGSTVLVTSHEQDLLRSICDEIWWLRDGCLEARGDPKKVLERYNRHVSERLRTSAASASQPLAPLFRRGDGRAEVLSVETLDDAGRPTMTWQSGAPVAVHVRVRFAGPVADPVVGILIRTRIGVEVYGTNTELENLKLGPVSAGETLTLKFQFRCELCPQQYTLTVASHDPDGIWHDWLEDAVAFSVTDTRYTAGVANLRAKVSVERGS